MVEQEVRIVNQLGLHARAAAKLVHLAARYRATVRLRREHQEVNGKSILGILLLAAGKGTTLLLTCEGDDEQDAMRAIVKLVEDRFEEEPTGKPS